MRFLQLQTNEDIAMAISMKTLEKRNMGYLEKKKKYENNYSFFFFFRNLLLHRSLQFPLSLL